MNRQLHPAGGARVSKMTFDDLKSEPAPMTPPAPPAPEPEPLWDARPSGNFEAEEEIEPPPPAPAPWDEKPAGETRAFPKMSFEDFDKAAAKPAAEEKPAPSPAPAPAPSAAAANHRVR
jgi:hypothetical protein